MKAVLIILLLSGSWLGFSQTQTTYCNPIDIDYTYMSHYRAERDVSYRSGADPAVINFNGKYFMFVTRSHGYWMSEDMGTWKFIKPQSWYFNGCNAPAAAVRNGKVIVLGDPSGRGAVIETYNPELGNWQTNYAVLNLPVGVQDPDLFVDDDNQVYLYEESSNKWPIHGIALDTANFYIPVGEQKDLFNLHPEQHGWERFGQNHTSDMDPYIEGPWMTKHGDTYYLEYSAPGTQWNVYADGVYTSKSPLGPFEYADYNPVSYKPGGFLTGAGHGSTVKDNQGHYWHFASMPISVNFKFERRIGMFPTGFEEDGQMYVNTAYGDYPHYLPEVGVLDHKNRFTGWMLLSKGKSIKTNAVVKDVVQKVADENASGYQLEQEAPNYEAARANDENLRTFWVAPSNSDSLYLEMDLGAVMDIRAVQINFQDFNANIFGKPDTLRQQFYILTSLNGKDWEVAIDYSKNQRDQPHAYIELGKPIAARYIKYQNVYFPNKYLAIGELRIFGKGRGKAPAMPKSFEAKRQADQRNCNLTWKTDKDATGYVLYWGIAEDRLNNSVMIYDQNSYELRALNTGVDYYYQVEAFNENGISKKSLIIKN
ncbi:family 43 glycosylhydrolase [Marinoscillum pacificum]|uniref:family 43 glycosylhydrolase n=1 Tax=Marinoscillum pacificum TaxID=392723 RepID=UPI0021588F1A|nr:family 43 glycosylhydrolase [Marinoscillum pacificum]